MHRLGVVNPLEKARFDFLVQQAALGDRDLAVALGVSQPTAWRLRHGKISRINVYITRLEHHLGISVGTGPLQDKDLVEALVMMASYSPALRNALRALHDIMRSCA
jgi:predicted transcriptional regulator